MSLREIAADREARAIGEELIAAGRTALLTVAGGQGSRLGFEGPKGLFPVTPLRNLPLFAHFAEKLAAARRRYGAAIPWLVMTSRGNHEQTLRAFERADWYGLGAASVRFFTQGMLPALSTEGRLLLAPDGGLSWSPDGHGGVIAALRSSGLLPELDGLGRRGAVPFPGRQPPRHRAGPGVPGIPPPRPGRDVSSKVVEKTGPGEKIGVIASIDGRAGGGRVLGPRRRAARGARRARRAAFRAGLDRDPRARGSVSSPATASTCPCTSRASACGPSFRGRAAPTLRTGRRSSSRCSSSTRFPWPTGRCSSRSTGAEEFAPLKNREGTDSIETCRRGQVEKAARWLETCGVAVPRGQDGRPRHLIEISPLFALDRDEIAAKRTVPARPHRCRHAARLIGACPGASYRHVASAVLVLLVLAAAVGPASPRVSVPDTAEARLALRELIFAPIGTAVRAAPRTVTQPGDGLVVRFQVERSNGSVYQAFTRADRGPVRLDSAGTFIIKRSAVDGFVPPGEDLPAR